MSVMGNANSKLYQLAKIKVGKVIIYAASVIPSQDGRSDTNPSIVAILEPTTPPILNAKTACQ
eukprot:6050738-Amphidinium_carterae.1